MRRRPEPASTWPPVCPAAWLLCLACLLPFALSGCTSLHVQFPREASHAPTGEEESTLRTRVMRASAQRAGQSGFRLLENGADAFAARALATMHAEQTLDIQTYLIHDGMTTRVLVKQVLDAAARGVRVRILIDDMGSRGNDFGIATLAAHPNIEVRLFNPVRLGRESEVSRTLVMLANFRRLHRRMHNKLWIADNAVAISGGRNVGDAYFGAAGDINFADLDLLSAGPITRELSRSFDAYWNSPNAVPVEAFVTRRPSERDLRRLQASLHAYIATAAVQQSAWLAMLRARQESEMFSLGDDTMTWAAARALWDDPAKIDTDSVPAGQQTLIAGLQSAFAEVREDVLLVSAYFVPGDVGVAFFRDMATRGVRVRVLTNSLQSTDVPFVWGAYADYREPLLRAGIELYEMKPRPGRRYSVDRFGIHGSSGASLHTKAMVFDNREVFIGSFNLDARSLRWNTEVGVLVDSPVLARSLRDALAMAFDPGNSHRLQFVDGKILYRSQGEHGDVVVRRPPAGLLRRLQAWLSDQLGPDDLL